MTPPPAQSPLFPTLEELTTFAVSAVQLRLRRSSAPTKSLRLCPIPADRPDFRIKQAELVLENGDLYVVTVELGRETWMEDLADRPPRTPDHVRPIIERLEQLLDETRDELRRAEAVEAVEDE